MSNARLTMLRRSRRYSKSSGNCAPNEPQSESGTKRDWLGFALVSVLTWRMLPGWLRGGVVLCLALLLITLTGCVAQTIRVPCGPDPDSIKDIELPERPVAPQNGNLADDLRVLGDRVRVDNQDKAGQRAELRHCLK